MFASRPVFEAGSATVSKMSTSLPFLYQTKTISSWSLAGSSSMCRPRHRGFTLRRNFSNSIRDSTSDQQASIKAPEPGAPPPKKELVIRRTTNIHGPEPRFGATGIGSTEHSEPDLQSSGKFPRVRKFLRRTVGETSEPSYGSQNSDQRPESDGLPEQKPQYIALSRRTSENDFDFKDSNEFDKDINDEEMYSTRKPLDDIQKFSGKRRTRDSTITESERAAFQKIFSDIFERSKRTGSNLGASNDGTFESSDKYNEGSDKSSPGLTETDDRFNIQKDSKLNAKLKLNHILSMAMQRTVQTRAQMEAAIEKYPPPLQAAAAKAMGYVEGEMEQQSQFSRGLLDAEELETLRGPERARVEGLMSAASTDFELMEIMEKEVFSLISKLGLGDTQTAQPVVQHSEALPRKKKPKGWKKAELRALREQKASKAKGKPAEIQEATPPNTSTGGNFGTGVSSETALPSTTTAGDLERGVSPLALYGPLYPSYLLFGLRLLDRSFAKPSPLTLSILPKIKSLGFISHVLGASTQFYNELLRIYRYRYDDLSGMRTLLNEMEQAALDFDKDTFFIVCDVADLQFSIYRGDKGSTMKALWTMPEFAHTNGPRSFRNWKRRIWHAVHEKEQQSKAQHGL
ncbi:hypothetical protein PZA11_005135 [Diplocarpon coronariae]|uniref:Mtf2-like C-terminal domain-containing protein n=1 Tax=Diplocarpon coronariae TaxID=2795749 RepID=A0A218Z9S0_9HELO|nr:hypothetical protein JHW43_009030 [Diplocarpon mali]OWP04502.1 hypothetical protein B2J93_1361 [Marssonina coronariae]